MNVILLGAPGAGKGTQGALLAKRHGLLHLATGDVLREAVRAGSRLGEEAKKYMDAGELVPDEVILGLVREKLTDVSGGDGSRAGGGVGAAGRAGAADGANGYVLDGFPRTVVQAEALDRILAGLDDDGSVALDAVVVIEVPTEVLIKRVSGRRTCTECGAVFNVHYDPSEKAGACDACGGKLVRRADDDPETVRRRLEVYRERTAPLVDYYRQSDTPVHFVDGDRPVDQVQSSISEAVKSDAATAHGARA